MTQEPYIVVVGLDEDSGSRLALQEALHLAEARQNAEVHVIAVSPPIVVDLPGYDELAGPAQIVADRVQAAVDEHASRAGNAQRAVRVVSHVRVGVPETSIAQLAADLNADLVVVGSHSRKGLTRALLGSVAEGVVRWAPCPVLVVRPKAEPEKEPVIEPACPRCVTARRASHGQELWCEQHRERHGRRHTYHQRDRLAAETNMPLVVR